MKKLIIFFLFFIMVLLFLCACRAKHEEITLPPPFPETTTPQAKEQPKVEKVMEATKDARGVPSGKESKLTEEEIFMSKNLEEMNIEAPLQMIHFDYNEYYIRSDAKPILEANAALLEKFPSVKILIEGHCDERGTEEYNLALGEKRASSAVDYLVSLGISPTRMRIISYGKSQLLDHGHNEMAWQRNRRAQFLIIGK